jgi:hypothetical protein
MFQIDGRSSRPNALSGLAPASLLGQQTGPDVDPAQLHGFGQPPHEFDPQKPLLKSGT